MKCNKKGHIAKHCELICKYCHNLHTNTVCIFNLNHLYSKILAELTRINRPVNDLELNYMRQKVQKQMEIEKINDEIKKNKAAIKDKYYELNIENNNFKIIAENRRNKIQQICNVTYTSTTQPIIAKINKKYEELAVSDDRTQLTKAEEIEQLKQEVRKYGSVNPVYIIREGQHKQFIKGNNYNKYVLEQRKAEILKMKSQMEKEMEKEPQLIKGLFSNNKKQIEQIRERNRIRNNNINELTKEIVTINVQIEEAKRGDNHITIEPIKTGLCQIAPTRSVEIPNCTTISMLKSDRVNLANQLKKITTTYNQKKRRYQLAMMTEEKVQECKEMIMKYRDQIVKLQAATMNEERAWKENYLVLVASYKAESERRQKLQKLMNQIKYEYTHRPDINKAGKFDQWESRICGLNTQIRKVKEEIAEELKKQNENLNHKLGKTVNQLIQHGRSLIKAVNQYVDSYDNKEKAEKKKRRVQQTKEQVNKIIAEFNNKKSQLTDDEKQVLLLNPKINRAVKKYAKKNYMKRKEQDKKMIEDAKEKEPEINTILNTALNLSRKPSNVSIVSKKKGKGRTIKARSSLREDK
jgi:hypothetical protein